ncbi:MAG TPA: HipA N-terminal domain-containing protein [Polyangia bacterium]|nr:HipA N-terminal domain-containing protein [Polyangia bacterium]
MANTFLGKLTVFLKTWGLSAEPPADRSSNPTGVDVVLNLTAEEPLLVGTLSSEGGEYVFRYSEPFKHRLEIPPIGAFPDRDTVYRSRELWPFFQVRLPPFDRPDVRRVLEERNLDQTDLMSVLPALGGRTVTSPYNLVPHGVS